MKTNINSLPIYFIRFYVNLVLKKFKIVKYYSFTLTIMIKGLWLNSEQTTDLNCTISSFLEAARAVLQ